MAIVTYRWNIITLLSPSANVQWKLLSLGAVVQWPLFTYQWNIITLLSPSANIQWKMLSIGAVIQWSLSSPYVLRQQGH